jgi:hypothetical protein
LCSCKGTLIPKEKAAWRERETERNLGWWWLESSNVHTELRNLQPTVETVVDSDEEADHTSTAQHIYHTVEKTDFNDTARLPVLNLNQYNCSNECVANSTRWTRASKVSDNTGWSMRVNALQHSGCGNVDSDSDPGKSPISSS